VMICERGNLGATGKVVVM